MERQGINHKKSCSQNGRRPAWDIGEEESWRGEERAAGGRGEEKRGSGGKRRGKKSGGEEERRRGKEKRRRQQRESRKTAEKPREEQKARGRVAKGEEERRQTSGERRKRETGERRREMRGRELEDTKTYKMFRLSGPASTCQDGGPNDVKHHVGSCAQTDFFCRKEKGKKQKYDKSKKQTKSIFS